MASILKSALLAWALVLSNLVQESCAAAVPDANNVNPDLDVDLAERSDKKVITMGFSVERKPAQSVNETSQKLERLRARVTEVPLQNQIVEYISTIYVGSNRQAVEAPLDTGSSDLWIANSRAGGSFDASESYTFRESSEYFEDDYGIPGHYTSATGYWASDNVALSPSGQAVQNLKFGYATQSSAGSALLGIGLEGLEGASLPYPNLPAALKQQGFIDKNAYSLYLNSIDAESGTIIFGGYDTAKYSGELVTLPLSGQANANGDYYRLDITLNSISTGGSSLPIYSPVNLDSGTSYTYLPQDAFDLIYNEFNGGYIDAYGDVFVPCYQENKSIDFNFNGITITVPFDDIVTQAIDTYGYPIDGVCILTFGANEGEYLLGDNFLRHAYVLYDLDDRTISLAPVRYTDESNIVTF